MKNYTSKIIYILPKGWIKSIIYITLLTIFNAIFELFGIGLVIPFLSVFLGETNPILENITFINNLEKEILILIFILLFLIVFIIKNLFLLFFQQIKINFAYDLAKEISTKLYLHYLKKNYIFFTLRNTSELIRNTISETNLLLIWSPKSARGEDFGCLETLGRKDCKFVPAFQKYSCASQSFIYF